MKLPNILYVFADQWPAFAFGYAGDPNVQTPRIDAFSRASVNCHQAIANTPICTPSRATLLTGLLPDKHGLFLNDAPLNPELPSLGKFFSQLGYATGYVGKWHVDGHGRRGFIPKARRHGFDYWKVLECTHNYNNSKYYDHDDPNLKTWEGYDAIAQTEDVIQYLGNRDADRPFAMMLSWGPPHNPYDTAPNRFKALYDPETLLLRPNVHADDEKARTNLAGFYAHCTALDSCFGALLDALEHHGIAENTIVIFTADHGDHLGAHYLREKQSPLEESLRIPFLIRWPEKLKPHVNDSVFSILDFFPTLCGLLETPPPAHLQGRDFAPHFIAESAPSGLDNAGFCASYHLCATWPRTSPRVPQHLLAREYRGVRTTRHTYCRDLNGPWLLFDNLEDPYQLHNRVNDPALATIQAELDALLHARLQHYDDAFSPGMEYVKAWNYTVDATTGNMVKHPTHEDGDNYWAHPAPSV